MLSAAQDIILTSLATNVFHAIFLTANNVQPIQFVQNATVLFHFLTMERPVSHAPVHAKLAHNLVNVLLVNGLSAKTLDLQETVSCVQTSTVNPAAKKITLTA